jgi:hypothetical protein
MTYTPQEAAAKRLDSALARLSAFDELADAVAEYRDAAIRHARTNTASDYLDELLTEDRLACIMERAIGWDLCDTRELLRDEARRECSYDMKEECYVDHNGEPIRRAGSFGSSHPDAGRGFRL